METFLLVAGIVGDVGGCIFLGLLGFYAIEQALEGRRLRNSRRLATYGRLG
jgi:hypothetical protein